MKSSDLSKLVSEDAAVRRRQRLQPVGGKGDKIFPPTYPGEGRNAPPRHVFERRLLDGRETWCVLVDSVQSQANRLEESLLGLIAGCAVNIPHVVVDFSDTGLTGITRITSLEAPHRVYDAIFRDSLLDGKRFIEESSLGQNLVKASGVDASALLETSPTALLFGCWHSTGQGGGLGAKFPRSLVSEIMAIDVPVEEIVDGRTNAVEARTAGRRTGSRIDPLGILRKVEVYKGPNGWALTESEAGKSAKRVRPSEINHGNIAPSVQPLGITCDHIEQTFVLSFAALRRLRFGSPAKDIAGRTLLAALGLLAVTEQDARGYALRSRCDLVCEDASKLEVVHPDGSTASISLDRESAKNLYKGAFDSAEHEGFNFPHVPIELKPQEKLVAIVRKSQELALAGKGGESDEGDRNGEPGSGD